MSTTEANVDRHPPVVSDQRPTVIVTDAERGSAVSVIRSLGRIGCRVIAASASSWNAGSSSRYASDSFVYPDPMFAPTQCAAALLDAAGSRGADLLIPVTDEVILPLAAAREEATPPCDIAMASSASLQQAWDKRATVELAQRLDVACPRGEFTETAPQAQSAAQRVGWPVVVKPIFSRLMRGGRIECFRTSYAADANELAQTMHELGGRCGVMIQEVVDGPGCGVEVLARHGRVLAAFQHRRVREVPLSGGVSSLRVSDPLDERLLGHTRSLMEALAWDGLAMVEFKLGAEGPRLMEINGRIWGSLPLAVKSGMDFPAKLLAEHRECSTATSAKTSAGDSGCDADYRIGVRCRNLPLDLAWAAQVLRGSAGGGPSRWAALQVFGDLLLLRNHWDVWDFRDPMPALASARATLGRVGRKFVGAITPRRREQDRNGQA